jgi:hypothetical protein
MPPIHQLTHAVRRGEFKSPKTVLGFFAGMVGIAASVMVLTIWLVERTASLRYIVPSVLIAFLAIFLLVLISVMVIALKDPSKLMLGQISGRDYAEIQKITLGDSSSGERVERMIVTPPSSAVVTASAEVMHDPDATRRVSGAPGAQQLGSSSSVKDK